MASDAAAKYELFFASVKAKLTPAIHKRGLQAAAQKSIDLIQERSNRGMDVGGRGYKSRSQAYMKRKAKLMGRGRGRFAATSPNDYMRLGGGLFRSMSYRNIRSTARGLFLSGTFELYIKGSKEQRQLEGLRRKGYNPWPLGLPGTSVGSSERRQVVKAYKDAVRVRLPKGVLIDI